jgi:hypothetical protein
MKVIPLLGRLLIMCELLFESSPRLNRNKIEHDYLGVRELIRHFMAPTKNKNQYPRACRRATNRAHHMPVPHLDPESFVSVFRPEGV